MARLELELRVHFSHRVAARSSMSGASLPVIPSGDGASGAGRYATCLCGETAVVCATSGYRISRIKIVNPAFFIAPAMNPRTVCFCQPIFSMISASVAPFFRWSMTTTLGRLPGDPMPALSVDNGEVLIARATPSRSDEINALACPRTGSGAYRKLYQPEPLPCL